MTQVAPLRESLVSSGHRTRLVLSRVSAGVYGGQLLPADPLVSALEAAARRRAFQRRRYSIPGLRYSLCEKVSSHF
jgi:hypothetical protein